MVIDLGIPSQWLITGRWDRGDGGREEAGAGSSAVDRCSPSLLCCCSLGFMDCPLLDSLQIDLGFMVIDRGLALSWIDYKSMTSGWWRKAEAGAATTTSHAASHPRPCCVAVRPAAVCVSAWWIAFRPALYFSKPLAKICRSTTSGF
jgi:hypothetical protein